MGKPGAFARRLGDLASGAVLLRGEHRLKRKPPAALSNEEIAQIVSKDPVRYPGLMQEWARLVLVLSELSEQNRRARQVGARGSLVGRTKP